MFGSAGKGGWQLNEPVSMENMERRPVANADLVRSGDCFVSVRSSELAPAKVGVWTACPSPNTLLPTYYVDFWHFDGHTRVPRHVVQHGAAGKVVHRRA